MTDITLPNGVVIRNVPQGATKEQIRQKAIAAGLATEADFGMPAAQRVAIDEVNAAVSPGEAFRVAMGRGFATVGRGVGLMEPEAPQVTEAFRQLGEQYPVATTTGEIVGQAAPFVVPGVGLGGIAGTGLRTLGAAGLGAMEGGVISRGQGGSTSEIIASAGLGGALGGGIEAAFPVLNRIGGSLFRRAFGTAPRGPLFDSRGQPTAEMSEAMRRMNVSLDDLNAQATMTLESVPQGVNPEQAVRAARFQELGIPPTRGNVTQDFVQQAQEERLASMASNEAAAPLRQLQLDQSEAFISGINSMVDAMGVPAEVGDNMKLALTGRLENLAARKNQLYRDFAENSPQVASMPIIGDNIQNAIADRAELRRIARLPGNSVDALQSLLIEFGVDQTPEAVEAFTKSGGEIIPLNLGNFEEFRQALNQLSDNTTPGGRATSAIVGRIKTALDNEVDVVEQSLLDANALDSSIVDSLREARATVARMKTEFSPQSVVGRLTGFKNDGVTPVIEASKAYDAVMGKSQPIEYLQRTVESLRNSPKGKVAIGAMQAETVMRALDTALRAPSRKTSGIQTVGYSQFVKALEGVGKDRLDILFADNPRQLARLMMFKEAAQDLTVDARATPRGSAPVLLDIANRISRTPGIAPFVDAVKWFASAGADERAIRRALDARPQMKKAALQIQREYPAIAASLGIAGMTIEDER